MSKLLRKAICLGLVIVMLFTMTATTFAASNSPYTEGNPENIVITLKQLSGSTYQVVIRNDRDTAIGNWKLSFKTNFGLSNPVGVDWSAEKDNTYTFWDAENGSIASDDNFTFTVVSDKKKNSEIHNVSFEYLDVEYSEIPDIVLDVSALECLESDDGNIYFLSIIMESLSGTLTHSENVKTFSYSIKDREGEVLKSDNIHISETWRIDGIGFGSGYNLLTLSAKTTNGIITQEYTIINENPENINNLDIDTNMDSDGDSLPDYYEKLLGLDPQNADSDDDGLPDNVEFLVSKISPISTDADGDGVSDADEDSDCDGLSNLYEYLICTDLSDEDTDGDGLRDGDETQVFFTDPLKEDTDGDSVTDFLEVSISSNPSVANNEFDCVFKYLPDEGSKITPTVEFFGLSAEQVNQFHIIPVVSGLLADEEIPGYIDCAYSFSEIGSFGKVTLKFEIDHVLFEEDDFLPAIYWFDEENQLLEKVDTQTISENIVSAEVTHFSKYIVLNSKKQDKCWDYTFLYDENDEENYNGIDIVFVIDSSGSMTTNDSSDIRKAVTKSFIDRLTDNDLGAVVDFDYSAKICSGFSAAHDELYRAVDSIDSNGGTNLSAGISCALDLFSDSGYNGADKQKYIIMLTDGQGSYSTSYTTRAHNMGVTIYTVGLGSGVSSDVLTAMAEGTGGAYYHADKADQLRSIFDRIADESELKKDSDNDGLKDYFEKEMMNGNLRLGTGVPLTGVNYLNPDSDNDMLKDGEEITVMKNGDRVYVKMKSNPTIRDTDRDGFHDYSDSFPLIYNTNGCLVYQSKNLEGVDEEGEPAKDLEIDDIDTETIRAMHPYMKYQIDGSIEYTYADFYNLINLGTTFANKDVKNAAIEIANQFIKESSDKVYSNTKLTESVKKHERVNKVVNQYKDFVLSTLSSNYGDLGSVAFNTKHKYTMDKAYFTNWQALNGYGILIHDFHGFTITITDYAVQNNSFNGNLHFHYYDNFGLDADDADYFDLAGFRAWFDLQHDKRLNGQYKAFITYFDFDVPFNGTF